MPDPHATEIKLSVPQDLMSLMHLVLSRGAVFEANPGVTLKSFLTDALSTEENYLENRVQTIFMDGHAVDDTEKTLITGPCTVALSAAMPGVFGAAFRKKGLYSGLRAGYGKKPAPENTESNGRKVRVKVKCFNQVARDLGDGLLARGIEIDGRDLENFWRLQQDTLEKRSVKAETSRGRISLSEVPALLSGPAETVRIRAVAES